MIKKYWKVLTYIARRFFEDDCANRAAALSYTTLLSLVPLVLMSFWVLSFFPVLHGTGQVLQQFVVNNFVAHSADVISRELDHFLNRDRLLSWSNLIALAVISILMIYDLVNAFNQIWHIKMKRNFALSFSFYSLVLLLMPVFFGIFILFSSYLATQPFIAGLEHIYLLKTSFLSGFPYIAAFLIFTFLNWVLPDCPVPFRSALIAGFITTVFFELAKMLFGWYIGVFPTYQLIYGALSAIPIFLVWIYISWVIILLGALICHVLTHGIESNLPTR